MVLIHNSILSINYFFHFRYTNKTPAFLGRGELVNSLGVFVLSTSFLEGCGHKDQGSRPGLSVNILINRLIYLIHKKQMCRKIVKLTNLQLRDSAGLRMQEKSKQTSPASLRLQKKPYLTHPGVKNLDHWSSMELLMLQKLTTNYIPISNS